MNVEEGFTKPEDSSSEPTIVKLRHPQTGEPTLFLFSIENKKVYELITFNEAKR